jgi:hypothetical protein
MISHSVRILSSKIVLISKTILSISKTKFLLRKRLKFHFKEKFNNMEISKNI